MPKKPKTINRRIQLTVDTRDRGICAYCNNGGTVEHPTRIFKVWGDGKTPDGHLTIHPSCNEEFNGNLAKTMGPVTETITVDCSNLDTWPPVLEVVYMQGRRAGWPRKGVLRRCINEYVWHNPSNGTRIKRIESGDRWQEIPIPESL